MPSRWLHAGTFSWPKLVLTKFPLAKSYHFSSIFIEMTTEIKQNMRLIKLFDSIAFSTTNVAHVQVGFSILAVYDFFAVQ